MEALFLAPEGRRLVELSQQLGLHKTTVLRLLRTLVATGAARRDLVTDRYYWNPMQWVALASSVREAMARADAVGQVLQQTAEALGETVVLATPDIAHRRTIKSACAEPSSALHVDLSNVRVLPMHATCAGKVLLSGLSESALEEWVRGELAMVTPHTITDPKRLAQEVRTARRQGYAICHQEAVLGLSGMAVAVLDNSGRLVGALCAVAPTERFPSHSVEDWVSRLRSAADSLSVLLYPGQGEGERSGTPGRAAAREGGSEGAGGAHREPGLRNPYRMI